ncbi:MAG: hypothetical protein ACXWV5_09140 [Flavitalea sp.]
MKNVVRQLSSVLVALLVILTGCKKDDIIQPIPGGGQNPGNKSSNAFRIVVDSLPGTPAPVYGLFAMFSIINEDNDTIVSNKKMTLSFNGKYQTDTLKLDSANYKIAKFQVVDAGGRTNFVTPILGSAKAWMVEKPLGVPFSLPKPVESKISLQVLRVALGDKATDYGYTEGSFNNNIPQDPAGPVKIKIRPLIKVGDVVYDSIPVQIIVQSWDNTGILSTKFISLSPGTNEITLLRSVPKYKILLMHWGTTDQLELTQNDIQEGTLYTLGGSKQAKKLQSEIVYKLTDGTYKAMTKNTYLYGMDGKVSEIQYFQRKADNSPYMAMKDRYTRNGEGKVTKTIRYGTNNEVFTQTDFAYNQQGRVNGIKEVTSDNTTQADVEYFQAAGGTGVSGNYSVNIKYRYTKNYFTMNYNMIFNGGNLTEDVATTSHHNYEKGRYDYDFGINPYIHMELPDLFLSKSSKHNRKVQYKEYAIQFPTNIPSKFEYTYDAVGYPKELITTYIAYGTGVFLFKTKTVYNY